MTLEGFELFPVLQADDVIVVNGFLRVDRRRFGFFDRFNGGSSKRFQRGMDTGNEVRKLTCRNWIVRYVGRYNFAVISISISDAWAGIFCSDTVSIS